MRDEADALGALIRKTYADFRLNVSILGWQEAPQLIRYRVQPASGQAPVHSQQRFLELAAANVARRLDGMPPPEMYVEPGPNQQKRRHRKRQSG